jgi:uncharacterized membrane protein
MIELLLLIVGITILLMMRPLYKKIIAGLSDRADIFHENVAIEAAKDRQANYEELTSYMKTNNITRLHQHVDIMKILEAK